MEYGTRRPWVIAALLFIIAWLTTYNAAVMCGDDVTHLHGAYGSLIYLPNFRHDWIPNRVFDLYGRNLTARFFDAIFFPLRALTGVSFFIFYKLFSATIFAVFVSVVFGYLRAQLRRGDGLHDVLLQMGLAAAVFLVLPWTNQVRLLCYEAPAFLSFVVLAELAKMFCAEEVLSRMQPASVALLGFVVAFSLEAYAAILLLAVVTGMICLRVNGAKSPQGGVAAAGILSVSCVVALVTEFVFSARPQDVHKDRPMPMLSLHLFGHLVFNLNLCGVLLVAGILLWAALVLTARQWRVVDFAGVIMALFGIVLAATLIVVGLISFQADQNYFDFGSYPWGGLTLISQLLGVLAAGLVLAPSPKQNLGVAFVKIFVLFVVASRIAIAVLGGQVAAAQKSSDVAAAYGQVIAGANGVVHTNLALDGIEMQARPLPTTNSAPWFIRNYHDFFEKYYGVDFTGSFE